MSIWQRLTGRQLPAAPRRLGMSIRLRMTLLYSVILALTLIAFSTTLYVAQSNLTYGSIRNNLMRQAAAYANGQGRFDGHRPGQAGDTGNSAPLSLPPDQQLPAGTLPGRWTQIRSADGTVTGRTFDLYGASLPLSSQGLQAVQSGAGWFETGQVQEQPLLIYSKSFLASDGSTEIVQSASPIAQQQQSLNTLRLILFVGSSLVIVAAFAIGWALSGAALNPIHRITQTAQAIGAEHDFSRRVEHRGPRDEIGQLALTFNDMLAELEGAYRQLEGALDSQRRFVADASHELRTPLTTVRGNIELLRREPPMDPQERADVLSDTTEEVERLIRLVNQLLVLARADAGQRLHREPLALKPMLDDVARQVRHIALHHPMQFEPAPDVEVLGDRDALKQVLLILIDNASVHTPAGTSLDVSAVEADGRVAISVRDTGPGIAPDILPHIFERFYRGEVSRSGASTGLGLAIAQELVSAQGGTIGVTSRMGEGSAFTVTLPKATE